MGPEAGACRSAVGSTRQRQRADRGLRTDERPSRRIAECVDAVRRHHIEHALRRGVGIPFMEPAPDRQQRQAPVRARSSMVSTSTGVPVVYLPAADNSPVCTRGSRCSSSTNTRTMVSSARCFLKNVLHVVHEPLLHLPCCPDKALLVGFSCSVAPCPLSAAAGRHDRDLIGLAAAAVRKPTGRTRGAPCEP